MAVRTKLGMVILCFLLLSTGDIAASSSTGIFHYSPVINKTGQVGLFNTLSAKTLGMGRLSIGINANATNDRDYITDMEIGTYNPDDNSINFMPIENDTVHSSSVLGDEFDLAAELYSFNFSLGYGLARIWDVSVSMPLYVERMDEKYMDYRNGEGAQGAFGDLTIGTKLRFNLQQVTDILEGALYGHVTAPTGNKQEGNIPRHGYYYISDATEGDGIQTDIEGIDNDVLYAYTSGKPEIDMKMLWTLDFAQLKGAPVPLCFYFNTGVRWTLEERLDHVFLLNGGIESAPLDWLHFFLDFSGETRISNFSKGAAFEQDPLRLTPGISFTFPGGAFVTLGSDISLAGAVGDEEMSYIFWEGNHGGDYKMERITTLVEPKWRVTGTIGWSGFILPQDADKDGIKDKVDECPEDPEDYDGFEDEDGCPDTDNDGDGIPDSLDKCPNDPEDFDGFEDEDGCPDPDNDGDGIPDRDDKCPDEPEDFDGFEDEDGCPDPDNDGDGICDPWVTEQGLEDKYADKCKGVDQCPDEPEDIDGFENEDGCPDIDNDQDGIADSVDNCPDEPEDYDGFEDEDGCPDPDNDEDGIPDTLDKCPETPGVSDNNGCPEKKVTPKAKKLKRGRIILRGVNFESGKAVLTENSFVTLEKVVNSLEEWPDVDIRIEGHTDSVGSRLYNRRLSRKRAEAVKDYFVHQGISPDRLTAEGEGEEDPIATNSTAEGRARNRRVELHRVD